MTYRFDVNHWSVYFGVGFKTFDAVSDAFVGPQKVGQTYNYWYPVLTLRHIEYAVEFALVFVVVHTEAGVVRIVVHSGQHIVGSAIYICFDAFVFGLFFEGNEH